MNSLSNTKRNVIINGLDSFLCDSKNGERLFLSVFLVHVIFMCLRTTMFQFPNIVFSIEKYLAMLLILLKIAVFDKYNDKQLFFGTVLLIDAFLVMGFTRMF